MKKIVSVLVTLLILSSAYANETALNTYQISLGYTNSKMQDRSDKESKLSGIGGMTIGFSRQFLLPSNFSTASGLDFSFNSKTEYEDNSKETLKTGSFGFAQTFYYNIEQGNITIRPLFEVGIGNKRFSYKVDIYSISKSALYHKYALGTEILFTKNIGAQIKYGQSFSNHKLIDNEKIKLKENTLAFSLVYGI